jgi:hypothetical protein
MQSDLYWVRLRSGIWWPATGPLSLAIDSSTLTNRNTHTEDLFSLQNQDIFEVELFECNKKVYISYRHQVKLSSQIEFTSSRSPDILFTNLKDQYVNGSNQIDDATQFESNRENEKVIWCEGSETSFIIQKDINYQDDAVIRLYHQKALQRAFSNFSHYFPSLIPIKTGDVSLESIPTVK